MLKETGESNYITLLTGDVAFFYDSNALWNKFAPANLRIVVLNNGGGAIFRLIDGPGQMPEREEFLETRHNRNARLLCEDMNVEYAQASNFEELETELIKFYQPSNTPKVLEVFTGAEINTQKFKEYKELIYGLENI
jgi:2-succinyl-5-enolpyruvyl-6-hydroxy-3-cyclohexene-1-carboxylate synthase